MGMKQVSLAKFQSDDGKVSILCDADTALGNLHDFLMAVKGEIVDRMIKAQKDEEEVQQAQRAKEEEVEEEKK